MLLPTSMVMLIGAICGACVACGCAYAWVEHQNVQLEAKVILGARPVNGTPCILITGETTKSTQTVLWVSGHYDPLPQPAFVPIILLDVAVFTVPVNSPKNLICVDPCVERPMWLYDAYASSSLETLKKGGASRKKFVGPLLLALFVGVFVGSCVFLGASLLVVYLWDCVRRRQNGYPM